MTYFADLSPCSYHNGPFDAGNWRCPLLAVGWLDHPNDFPKGGQLAETVRDRLAFLRFAFANAYASILFRGWHQCSLCLAKGVDNKRATLADSHINLLVPGGDCVFIAPGRIDHYVEKHAYLMPVRFSLALMQCPDPRDMAYESALFAANEKSDSPLSRSM
jgi:hypothetical protein